MDVVWENNFPTGWKWWYLSWAVCKIQVSLLWVAQVMISAHFKHRKMSVVTIPVLKQKKDTEVQAGVKCQIWSEHLQVHACVSSGRIKWSGEKSSSALNNCLELYHRYRYVWIISRLRCRMVWLEFVSVWNGLIRDEIERTLNEAAFQTHQSLIRVSFGVSLHRLLAIHECLIRGNFERRRFLKLLLKFFFGLNDTLYTIKNSKRCTF